MKIVYGNLIFAREAVDEIPSYARKVYLKALQRLSGDFKHNLIKVSKDLKSVTLLMYPHLDTHAHPYLSDYLLIPIDKSLPTKHKIESKENPLILHRIETILSENNPRIEELTRLTGEEERNGLFSGPHRRFISRRLYWNKICREMNMVNSLTPENNDEELQLSIWNFVEHNSEQTKTTTIKSTTQESIKRESTAMSTSKPSAPTKWAFNKGIISSQVLDWGSGKGRDSKWLINIGMNVISYDPFFNPTPSPREINFQSINTILLNYVLNVIETKEEREKVLDEISNLAKVGTKVIIATRTWREIELKAKKSRWKKLNDGYVTGKNTFQKGFTRDELMLLCSRYGTLEDSIVLPGGIVCVISIAK